MSNLPNIDNYPRKKITLPISKKKLTIRGFVVREEKILIMAREDTESTSKDYLDAMCQIINSCVNEKFDPVDLNEVDLSYLFLRIRMMSKGENSKVTYRCKAELEDGNICDSPMQIELDLRKVEAHFPEGYQELFQVPNTDVHIKMRLPTIRDVMRFEDDGIKIDNIDSLKWEHLEYLISSCVESITEGTKDDSNTISDFTREDIVSWFEGVPDVVLDDIIDKYLTKIPYLRYSVKHTCPACGTKHEFDIVGLENFFG